MPRPQFILKTLLWLMLVVASFFAGVFFSREDAAELRNALKAEQESNAKTARMMRDVVSQLMQAENRIKKLEGR